MLGCSMCLQNFMVFGHCGSSWQNNNNFGSERNFEKVHYFVYFLLELLLCHLSTKICTDLAHPCIFDAKKNHIFCYFLYIVHQRTYLQFFLSHEHLECPNNMKFCTHTHVRNFDLTKFQIFCYFF